ncbi:MAG: hypothetical protein BGO12_03425 [Verrucomicrobia bacterium 61-8]|nr:PEP-CTERM sorting domain-containing protein [Verrucomicrobiota bacterium]OJV22743.1 MAG: hypothetical protein BGO12_03425 [Verrucomicrobia bacterium 61-8]
MKILSIKAALVALAIGGTIATASAANDNPNYAAGDLVMYFQNPGGAVGSDQTVMVSLGNASTVFRDGGDFLNIANIGTLLSDTFGANWYELDTLYFGVAANIGTASLGNTLTNGDPLRTVYLGRSRNDVGTVGQASSTAYAATEYTTLAGNINSQNSALENNAMTQAAALDTTTSTVDDQNPFTVPGQQGTAFAVIPGGVQQGFGTGSFGTYGTAGSVEGALDLYRIQAKNTIAGQYGYGEANGVGEYQGTLTIDNAGNISYITAVPEPSTWALLGLGAFAVIYMARRRSVAKA